MRQYVVSNIEPSSQFDLPSAMIAYTMRMLMRYTITSNTGKAKLIFEIFKMTKYA